SSSTGALEEDHIGRIAGYFVGESLELFCKRCQRPAARGQPVPVGVLGRPLLSSARAGAGAPARVTPVSGNLSFPRHTHASADFLLDARCSGGTTCPSIMRSALSRNCRAKLPRYSATQRRALLRRDSKEASILSSKARSEDTHLMASASIANSSSPN